LQEKRKELRASGKTATGEEGGKGGGWTRKRHSLSGASSVRVGRKKTFPPERRYLHSREGKENQRELSRTLLKKKDISQDDTETIDKVYLVNAFESSKTKGKEEQEYRRERGVVRKTNNFTRTRGETSKAPET